MGGKLAAARFLEVAAPLCCDYCVDVVYATNEETVAEYRLVPPRPSTGCGKIAAGDEEDD